MKKAVIFDLDGTLIYTLPDISRAMNKALSAYGLPIHAEEAYRLFTGDGAMNLTLRAVGDRKDLAPQVYQAYAAEYARNSRVLSAPYPGIADMLRALHQAGMRLCVLSNKDDPDARDVIRYYFPDQPFALVRGRLPDVPIKPDPTAALAIVRELGLSARDFWYVGDTRTDMRCAKNAGMDSIAVTWGFQKKEEIAPGEPGEYAASAEELTRRLLS